MKTYICSNCGYEMVVSDNFNHICPKCGTKDIEYQESDNEIEAIIDSVLEDVMQETTSNIINENEKEKSLHISDDNVLIGKINDKCTNCGQCRKTCEKIENIKYDLNKCKEPICTLCGSCVLSCPSNALYFKHNYKEVKRIIDLNEKIVVALVDPSVYAYLNAYIQRDGNKERLFVGALKKLGFDYVFNSAFAGDIFVLEEVTEFAERLKNKKLLPMITGTCPSWINYAEVYHKDLLPNISTCKNKVQMHSAIVKEYFSKLKGFEESKIVTVAISNCTSNIKEDRLDVDFNITFNELSLLIDEENIDFESIEEKDYDELLSEGSGSAYLTSISGGQSESFVRTFFRIMKRSKLKDDEIDFVLLRNVNGIRDASLQIGDYRLRIAIVEGLVNLEKLLLSNKYKRYHYIEVMNCKGGCVKGSGRLVTEINDDFKEIIYEKDRMCQVRCAHDNKEIKKIYSEFLSKPLSAKALETLHRGYKDKSNLLENK